LTRANEAQSNSGGDEPNGNQWVARVRAKLESAIMTSCDMGALEKLIERELKELGRPLLEEAVQKLADRQALVCPRCGGELHVERHQRQRKVSSVFGRVPFKRSYGFCPNCQERFYPADNALGLQERGHLFENPARRLKIPKAPVIMGTVLTEREVKQLLAQPDLTHRRGLRDRAILEVIYSTGMRRGEAAGLTIFDVQLDQSTIRVTGKGRKQRLLPLGKHAVQYVRLYLKEARPKYLPKFAPAPDALWLDRYHRPISTQGITQLISRYGKACGVEKLIDAHTLRRTCATQMLRGGAHPVVVAQMLGHSGLRSLSHYLRTTITDLMHSHSQSNPGR